MTTQKEEIQKILHKNFPQLAEKQLQEELTQVGQIMDFTLGEVIMDYGSYVRMIPLIIEGSIKVTREDDSLGKELLLYFLDAGDTCSMSFSCCMMDKKSAIRTEAVEKTRLIGIPVKYVDKRIANSGFGYEYKPASFYKAQRDWYKKQKMYVGCNSGYRSLVFISILQSRGYRNLVDVKGGFKAVKANGNFKISDYVCPTTML